jgi:hypothetical protein
MGFNRDIQLVRDDRSPIPLRADPDALNREVMISLARAAIVSRDPARAPKFWVTDQAVKLFTRGAVSPASTANTGGVFTQFALRIVASLVPISGAAALIARSLQLQWGGRLEIRVPALTLALAGFVGEAQAINVVNGQVTIPAKLTPVQFEKHHGVNERNG